MDWNQSYLLRWNNYHSSVVTVMRNLLNDRAFLDVTLACDGRSLQAHKLMLAACSDFFSDILRENQTEHPIIFLRDVTFWELEAIIDFIYNGQVNIMQKQLPGFIRTAEALRIKGLAAVNNNNNTQFFNNNIENLSLKHNTHLEDLKYNGYTQSPPDIKYEPGKEAQSPPAIDFSTYGKRRRQDSPSPTRAPSDEDSSRGDASVKGSSPLGKCPPSTPECPSPLSINETIQSLALSSRSPTSNHSINSSVASMASISMAKALSLSKLVHEISSQASIANLKSAALPPHTFSVTNTSSSNIDDLHRNSHITRDDETIDTPLPSPIQPAPPLQNTKDWAANKNEDGFPACSLCGKVFKHQGSLVAHYQVHQQRTKCPVCQKVLSRHYHMKVHLLTVHKVPDSEIDSLLRTQCV